MSHFQSQMTSLHIPIFYLMSSIFLLLTPRYVEHNTLTRLNQINGPKIPQYMLDTNTKKIAFVLMHILIHFIIKVYHILDKEHIHMSNIPMQ